MRSPAVALGCALSLFAHGAMATPSRWSLAQSPQAFEEEVAVRTAEKAFIESATVRLRRQQDPLADPLAPIPGALQALKKVDADRSNNWYARHLFARATQALGRWPEAVVVWERSLLDPETPPPFRADALAELAIAYARVNRQADEIAAYDAAIALEEGGASAHMLPRDFPGGGRVSMLANQAEGFLVMGDVERAIAGYRASLESVDSTLMGFLYSPTALWSLGVALDRSGDLAAALDSIALARSYDPNDSRIKGPGWFFVPSYEEHYYWALGHLLVARSAADQDDRIAAYERSVDSWATYLASAPATDHYVPVARARLKLANKEFGDLKKRAATPTPIDPRQPAQPAPKKP